MKKEQKSIMQAKNKEKHFKEIIQNYLNKIKISFKRSASNVEIDERTINTASK